MEDRQKKYLDKVVELLVDDTNIDYNSKTWSSPYIEHRFKQSYPSFDFLLLSYNLFEGYCKNVYGLIKDEMIYVWVKYKTIILDKMKYGR
jgi:hypothetical protein